MPAARLERHGLMQQLLLELAPPPPPTLDNFFPGKNGAALKALREALEGGERFVFLWGPGGSGKTHLLRAFAGAAAAKGRAAYVQAASADWARTGDLVAVAVDEVSRLASGIVLQLHPLSDADKAAALHGHAAARGIALDGELIRYLLTHFDRDMGTQIAALDALDRYSLQRKRPITLPLLKEALGLLDAGKR